MSSVIGTFRAEGRERLLIGRDGPFGKVPKGFSGKAYLRPVRFTTTAMIPVWIWAKARLRYRSAIPPERGTSISGDRLMLK